MISRLKIAAVAVSLLLLAACTRNEKRPEATAAPGQHPAAADAATAQPCVNLNHASAEELLQLPGVGLVMSRRIVEYRERHGPFRRPEEIIIIEGFSEKKYRAIADKVCVDP
ncbi:MAG TPA: helix-hairpin-helix domain-containing protein [Blastocatellia bacterium]|nr:helix-hairpin-helix domain-containing protein [Blastocatellia bacterium]